LQQEDRKIESMELEGTELGKRGIFIFTIIYE